MTQSISAQLKVVTHFLPFANEQEEAEARKVFEECGYTPRRFHTGFGYALYDKSGVNSDGKREGRPEHSFQNGDLVQVFKTVSEGEVLWEGQVSLNLQRDMTEAPTGAKGQAVGGFWVHGVQDDMDSLNWGRMFFDRLPAKLERDGKVIYGALDPFFETGTEGVIWSVQEFGVYGYAGLNALKDGDKLTVFSSVSNGEVEWEGPVAFDQLETPAKLDWETLHQMPQHMDPKLWLALSYDNRPVLVTPK